MPAEGKLHVVIVKIGRVSKEHDCLVTIGRFCDVENGVNT